MLVFKNGFAKEICFKDAGKCKTLSFLHTRETNNDAIS